MIKNKDTITVRKQREKFAITFFIRESEEVIADRDNIPAELLSVYSSVPLANVLYSLDMHSNLFNVIETADEYYFCRMTKYRGIIRKCYSLNIPQNTDADDLGDLSSAYSIIMLGYLGGLIGFTTKKGVQIVKPSEPQLFEYVINQLELGNISLEENSQDDRISWKYDIDMTQVGETLIDNWSYLVKFQDLAKIRSNSIKLYNNLRKIIKTASMKRHEIKMLNKLDVKMNQALASPIVKQLPELTKEIESVIQATVSPKIALSYDPLHYVFNLKCRSSEDARILKKLIGTDLYRALNTKPKNTRDKIAVIVQFLEFTEHVEKLVGSVNKLDLSRVSSNSKYSGILQFCSKNI